jgi:flagellar motor component MotA
MITTIIISIIIGTVFGLFFRDGFTPPIKETLADRRRRKLQRINLKE